MVTYLWDSSPPSTRGQNDNKTTKMRRDVYQAIADPTRRRILHLISLKPLNVNAVAANFKISRPAVSKHVRILKESGLVTIKKSGRERYCEARLQKLNEISRWVEQYRKFWTVKLDALEDYLNQIQKKKTDEATLRHTKKEKKNGKRK